MQSEPKKLIFIAGVEGSGTSWLRRLLAAPECCSAFSDKLMKLPDHPGARPLAAAFVDATRPLWARQSTLAEHLQAKGRLSELTQKMQSSPAFSGTTHFVLKRSFPFRFPGDIGAPDLWDVLDLPGETLVVAIYREPCAAVYSALRRRFDTDLRRLAVACDDQLTRLAAQVRAMDPERVRILSYRRLCEAPDTVLEPVAGFCGIPFDPIRKAILQDGIIGETDERYRSELAQADASWLEHFFDERRRRQWDILEASRSGQHQGA
jgi:hypothetical protein